MTSLTKHMIRAAIYTLRFHPLHCTVNYDLTYFTVKSARLGPKRPSSSPYKKDTHEQRHKEQKMYIKFQEEGGIDEHVCTSTPGSAWEMRRKLHMFCSPQITITPLASTTAETYSKHSNGLILLQVALNIPKSTTPALQSSLLRKTLEDSILQYYIIVNRTC